MLVKVDEWSVLYIDVGTVNLFFFSLAWARLLQCGYVFEGTTAMARRGPVGAIHVTVTCDLLAKLLDKVPTSGLGGIGLVCF
jgi:hypothetical protein